MFLLPSLGKPGYCFYRFLLYCATYNVDYLENILVSIAYDLAAANLSEERLNAQKDV